MTTHETTIERAILCAVAGSYFSDVERVALGLDELALRGVITHDGLHDVVSALALAIATAATPLPPREGDRHTAEP